jgi:hypothetical protein
MSSVNHPKYYDPAVMDVVKNSFHEVWAILEGQNTLVIRENEGDLKAAIIRKLLDLVSEGVTDRETLRLETLRELPLR